jgi:glycosyltransferase involved in cell wall biosynthesis
LTRVVVDGTPLLGTRTGVGRYTGHLLAALAAGPPGLDLAATAFTWRGLAGLSDAVPPGVRAVGRRAPARLLHEAWARSEFPPAELLTGRCDVVHATNFVLPPLRRARGVVTVHDLSYLHLPDTVTTASARYRELVPRSLRRAAVVLTPSEAIAAEIASEYGVPATATPLGVDPEWLSAARPTPDWLRHRGLPERYLLFVGTVEPRKDLPTLLAAYRMLRADSRDCPPLVLAGPSGWGPALDLAGLTPADVVQIGYLEEAVLRPVVAGAAALCFPSLYEGFGLPPLEALAAGTPVVGTDIPTTREVCGEFARLAPPRDPEALAEAMMSVLSAPPDPAAGRAHAAEFTWARTAGLTRQAYERALS